MDATHKEHCRKALQRSTQIIETSEHVAALCIIIVHESDDHTHRMEVVSCGQGDILEALKNRIDFHVVGEYQVGRDN